MPLCTLSLISIILRGILCGILCGIMPVSIPTWVEAAAYVNDPVKIIELWFQAGIIKNTRPCSKVNCNGTLHACHRPNRKEFADHGGWGYMCQGGDKEPHAVTITYGTMFYQSNYPLSVHMRQIFHYARIEQRVRLVYITNYKLALIVITPNTNTYRLLILMHLL